MGNELLKRTTPGQPGLIGERAALRRIAELVAREASASEVSEGIATELGRLMTVDHVAIWSFEHDSAISVASVGVFDGGLPIGMREPCGQIVERALECGAGAAAAIPIVIGGRQWGGVVVASLEPQLPACDAASEFVELTAAAIANAHNHEKLARWLTEVDAARRWVARDLHDGAQQRLVQTIVTLKLARQELSPNDGPGASLVDDALDHAQRANAELRDLARGVRPATLTRGGLQAAVDAIAARLDLPVTVDLPAQRLAAQLEATAYFIVAEALTNVVKHAHARHADVRASVSDGALNVAVRDDGIGGADPDGHGLVGMAERVSALGGRLRIESPAGAGTMVTAALPLSAAGDRSDSTIECDALVADHQLARGDADVDAARANRHPGRPRRSG